MTTLNDDISRVNAAITAINKLTGEKQLLSEANVLHNQWNTIHSFGDMSGFHVSVDRKEVREYPDQQLLALMKNRTMAGLHSCLTTIEDIITKLEDSV